MLLVAKTSRGNGSDGLELLFSVGIIPLAKESYGRSSDECALFFKALPVSFSRSTLIPSPDHEPTIGLSSDQRSPISAEGQRPQSSR